MNQTMNDFFCYLLESRINKFRLTDGSSHALERLTRQESALLETCTDRQRELLEQFQETQSCIQLMEMEAMFQAVWEAARELL